MPDLLKGALDYATDAAEIIAQLGEAGGQLKDLGPLAEMVLDAFEKTGAQFDQIKQSCADIRNDFVGILSVVAGQIEPAVDVVLKNIHNDIKDIGPALAGAIKKGQTMELLQLGLEAAFEQASFYGMKVFGAIAIGFGDALDAIISVIFEDLIPHEFKHFINSQKIGGLETMRDLNQVAMKQFEAYTGPHDANYRKVLKQFQDKDTTIGKQIDALNGQNDADYKAKAAQALATLKSAASKTWGDLNKWWGDSDAPHAMLDKFKAKAAALAGQSTSTEPNNTGNTNSTAGTSASVSRPIESHWKPEFTFLEKMGFIMSGSKVHNPYNQRQIDLLQQIAHNTSRSGVVPGIPGPPLLRDPILSMAEVSNMV